MNTNKFTTAIRTTSTTMPSPSNLELGTVTGIGTCRPRIHMHIFRTRIIDTIIDS